MTGRWPPAVLVLAGLGFTVVVEMIAYRGQPVLSAADGITGAVLLTCGVLAWQMPTARRVGALMLLAGAVWLLGTLVPATLLWHRGPLVQLTLTYPAGRLRRATAVFTVFFAYLTSVLETLARNDWVTLAMGALICAAAIDSFRQTSGPARKSGRVALGASLAFAGALALGALGRLVGWGADLAMLLLYDAVVSAVVLALLLELRFGRWVESAAADLVVGLGDGASASLQTQLRLAMGDPTVVVGYWAPAVGRFVDELGADLPAQDEARVVTPVDDNGAPLAVLVHDAAVTGDPELLVAVTSAARLAVVNVRLRAGIRESAEQLAESRRRIVEAADRQRRDLESEFTAGTVERLDRVDQLLTGLNTDGADEIRSEFAGTRAELLDFAHGVRPAALTTGGLVAALPLLAGRSPVPVELTVWVDRLPAAVEACVFFVCAESLTNVGKHAAATRVVVEVRQQSSSIKARISDDGGGGADPSSGSGLRGLADRVEALGGHITIRSRPGEGTTVVAVLPGE